MIQKEGLVSIGMPIYNGEKYASEAIQSILQQTHSNFELIISDNASTDMTEIICREYQNKDSRIRYVRQSKNRGPAYNFKFVFDEACGEYFMWAACDDVFSENFIEINQKFLSNNPEYVASTCPTGFDVGPLLAAWPVLLCQPGASDVEGGEAMSETGSDSGGRLDLRRGFQLVFCVLEMRICGNVVGHCG